MEYFEARAKRVFTARSASAFSDLSRCSIEKCIAIFVHGVRGPTLYEHFRDSRCRYRAGPSFATIRIKFDPEQAWKIVGVTIEKSRSHPSFSHLWRRVYKTTHVCLRSKRGSAMLSRAREPLRYIALYILRSSFRTRIFVDRPFFRRDLDANVSDNARSSRLNGARRESEDTNAFSLFPNRALPLAFKARLHAVSRSIVLTSKRSFSMLVVIVTYMSQDYRRTLDKRNKHS